MYIGLTKWGEAKWEGQIFPAKTKDKDKLRFYAEKLNAVELNSTHYHVPGKETVLQWTERVQGQPFLFCPKFPQTITHRGSIKPETKSSFTDFFLDSISLLGENLGPAFLQLNESLSIRTKDDLLRYLAQLPAQFKIFAEVRNETWFSSEESIQEFGEAMHRLNKGWVITDTPGRRDAAHMFLPVPNVFIRFVCEGDTPIDRYRIAQWKEVLSNWFDLGLENCYFFLHVHREAEAPAFAAYVQQELYPLTR